MNKELKNYLSNVDYFIDSEKTDLDVLEQIKTKLLALVTEYPNDAWKIWQVLGRLSEKENNLVNAEYSYRVSLELKKSSFTHYQLFKILIDKKDYEGSRNIFLSYEEQEQKLTLKEELATFDIILSFFDEISVQDFLRFEFSEEKVNKALDALRLKNYDQAYFWISRLTHANTYPNKFYLYMIETLKHENAKKERISENESDDQNMSNEEAYSILNDKLKTFATSPNITCCERSFIDRYHNTPVNFAQEKDYIKAHFHLTNALKNTKSPEFFYEIGKMYYCLGCYSCSLQSFERYEIVKGEKTFETEAYKLEISKKLNEKPNTKRRGTYPIY